MSEKKLNKVLEKQIEENFRELPKSVVKGFVDSLSETLDVTRMPDEILVGVGQINNLDFDSIEGLNSWDNLSDRLFEHQKSCEKCRADEYCEQYENTSEESGNYEIDWEVFTDGEFVENIEKGFVEIKGDTFTIRLNYDVNTFQILKSPIIIKRGLCSMCYPNQADLDAKGEYKCFGLP